MKSKRGPWVSLLQDVMILLGVVVISYWGAAGNWFTFSLSPSLLSVPWAEALRRRSLDHSNGWPAGKALPRPGYDHSSFFPILVKEGEAEGKERRKTILKRKKKIGKTKKKRGFMLRKKDMLWNVKVLDSLGNGGYWWTLWMTFTLYNSVF